MQKDVLILGEAVISLYNLVTAHGMEKELLWFLGPIYRHNLVDYDHSSHYSLEDDSSDVL